MKKLLATLAIAAIALTSTFATTDTNNVIINGLVEEQAYSFSLIYSEANADESNTALNNKIFDLSKTETESTDIFYLQRSNGNLNKDLLVSVDITAEAFEGEVNGADVTTAIIPAIELQNSSANAYASIVDTTAATQNNKKFNITVPYGYHSDSSVEIASFVLNITGDETTDAGTYTSDVTINYTYDQI